MDVHETADQFLAYLSASKSPNTVKLYRLALAKFTAHLRTTDVAAITVNEVEEFIQALAQQTDPPLAASTRETYLTAATLLVRWCIKRRLLTFDPADAERLRDLARENRTRRAPLPRDADPASITALLAAAQSEPIPAEPAHAAELARLRQRRNLALIHALRSSGMRVGEAVRLTRGDLDRHARSARVTGKGNKTRLVYFDDEAWEALENYLNERKDGTLTRALAELPVFARHSRTSAKRRLRLTTHHVQLIFAELSARAQLDVSITPHMLRHTFARQVLEATDNLAVVQDMLGHASPATTRIYARISPQRLRDAHRQAFDK